jgi:septum formation protein
MQSAGFSFDVIPSRAAESWSERDPIKLAMLNAEKKVRRSDFFGAWDRLLIGADTIVVLNRFIFGKPAGSASAERMLKTLSGKTHRVITGLCLAGPGSDSSPSILLRCDACVSHVTFNTLDASTLRDYLLSGEWQGKAGAYAIQAEGRNLVAKLSGDYENVIGLPVKLLHGLLSKYFSHCILQP